MNSIRSARFELSRLILPLSCDICYIIYRATKLQSVIFTGRQRILIYVLTPNVFTDGHFDGALISSPRFSLVTIRKRYIINKQT